MPPPGDKRILLYDHIVMGYFDAPSDLGMLTTTVLSFINIPMIVVANHVWNVKGIIVPNRVFTAHMTTKGMRLIQTSISSINMVPMIIHICVSVEGIFHSSHIEFICQVVEFHVYGILWALCRYGGGGLWRMIGFLVTGKLFARSWAG